MNKTNLLVPTMLWRSVFAALLAFCLTGIPVVAEEYTRIELPETEAELTAMPVPPPLPEGVEHAGDLLFLLSIEALTLLDLNAPIEVPETVEEITGIEYGNADGTPLLLDLYLPRDRDKPVPALIFIHGGSWRGGRRSDYKYYGVRFPQMGYAVATITYRLVPHAVFPAAVHDAKCAVRWMRAHGAAYGIDTDAIGVVGGSAGGHLAMMLGYSAGVAELEGDGGHQEYSSEVQAVVNLYGPVDLTLPEHHDNPTLHDFFGGKHYNDAPDLYRLASPLTHVDENAPPTLIIHGTDDDIVPHNQADMLAARLGELGVPYEYLKLEGYPHALDALVEVNAHCRWHIYRFLEKYLPVPE